MGLLKVVAVAVALVAASCGDDSGEAHDSGVTEDGASACPVLAGSWTIASHCSSSLVGMEVVVMQSGCALTTSGTFSGFSGTVAHDGSLAIAGTVSGTSVMCTGSATAQHWTQSCTGNCAVTLTH
jgi:polyisoprenoid-binding protein YceI